MKLVEDFLPLRQMMSNSISLTVGALTHLSANGLAIFSGQSSKGEKIRVVAKAHSFPRHPVIGETWEVEGEFREHPSYGLQLYATRGTYLVPKGRLIIDYLANHPEFVGVGKGKAKALYDAFGDELLNILDSGDAEALCTVLTAQRAGRLLEVWSEKRDESAVVAFLDMQGFDVRLANKLRRIWGNQVIKMLTLNPYYMLAFANWRVTDSAARKLGVNRKDERRLVGAVEATLYERLQDSHTVTFVDKLVERVAALLVEDISTAKLAIKIALSEGAIVGSEVKGYQPVGAAALETRIAERMRTMVKGDLPEQISLLDTENDSEWLAGVIEENEAAQGFELNAQQRKAVFLVASEHLSVVTGGAGVGKTTVLRVVIDVAKRRHLKVLQMALAGRAAKRMAEATGHEAMTIASFLHKARTGILDVTPDTQVVIDEASMLDLPTAFRVLKYLPKGVRLLLVGDSAQLPPIGFGLVFHRLVQSPFIPQVELTEVHRQAVETGIPGIAASIRAHTAPALEDYCGKQPGVFFIECSQGEIQSKLRELVSDWSDEDFQVLGAIKGGPAGTKTINLRFNQSYGTRCLPSCPFHVGEPVIHLINDYDSGLMNGTLGHVVGVENEGSPGIQVNFEGEVHFIPLVEVEDRLELAHAISVHKAQGSQFQRVAVVVSKSRILDQSLIYTSLTRGIEQVVFLGSRYVFEEAVCKPALAHQREVAFSV